MQKSSSVQIWLNETCSKTINVAPNTTCEDVLKFLANQQNISKRVFPHLEVHVVVDGKDHSVVGKGEKVAANAQSLAQRGINMEDPSHKNKYVLVVNAAAVQKAHKRTAGGGVTSGGGGSGITPGSGSGGSSSLYSLLKRTIGHQRSASLPSEAIAKSVPPKQTRSPSPTPTPSPPHISPPTLAPPSVADIDTNKHNKSPRATPVPPPIRVPQDDEANNVLDEALEERMPTSAPATPSLTPRASISPPRATFRARSKTISQSLSSSDLRTQEAINHYIIQKLRTRSSLGFERPPLAELNIPTEPIPENPEQHSPKGSAGSRARSPPPPQRIHELPPTITTPHPHAAASGTAIVHTRQRSHTTATAFPTRSTTPTKSSWFKHESKSSKTEEYQELLDVVYRLKHAT